MEAERQLAALQDAFAAAQRDLAGARAQIGTTERSLAEVLHPLLR